MSGPEPPKPGRPPDNAAAWLAKADSDLLNISNNLRAQDVPWDTVCFHAQQAAEKALKALLVHHGQLPARTHDLVALLESCGALDPGLCRFEPDCHRLNSYGVSSRYPGDIYEPEPEIARALVAVARDIVAEIRTRFAGPMTNPGPSARS